jgi:hypothetical protein
MAKNDVEDIKRALMDQAENRLGRERAAEIQVEIEVMAEQLAVLRNAAVDLQDEP